MINLVISGGQTGADQAGWRAAKAAGIATGGWMPKGFRTESPSGRGWGEMHPEFAEMYGAKEHETSFDYQPRTVFNASLADITLWFGRTHTPGYWCTLKAVNRVYRPFWDVYDGLTPEIAAGNLVLIDRRSINVAGNRESTNPGIGVRVESYLSEMFRIMKERA